MKAVLIVCFMFICVNGFSQTKGNLKVDATVRKTDGTVIHKAKVSLVDSDENIIAETLTNHKGRFEVSMPFDKDMRMVVEAKDCHSKVILFDTRNVPCNHQQWGYEYGGFTIKLEPAGIGDPDTVARVAFRMEIENFDYEKR
ncbi:MAG: carboxypeptidase-like regulatory domain-containing protein [Flavobacteriales bacterium]